MRAAGSWYESETSVNVKLGIMPWNTVDLMDQNFVQPQNTNLSFPSLGFRIWTVLDPFSRPKLKKMTPRQIFFRG